jgi:HSP90 family molecular chaperone
VGVIEDDVHKDELAKLLRFWSSKSGDGQISLLDYVDRMAVNQSKIYFVTGDGKEVAARSPVVEKLIDKNIEVNSCTLVYCVINGVEKSEREREMFWWCV